MSATTTDHSQKTAEEALTALFASGARMAMLRVFMIDPRRAYYQRQLSQATTLPIRAVQRELDRLGSVGLLYRRTEGNRTYFQVDTECPLFPELRALVLKCVGPMERLRATLSLASGLRLAFLDETGTRVLTVPHPGDSIAWDPPPEFSIECLDSTAFRDALAQHAPLLDPFLVRGTDLLGRRDDVLWRRIEAAGYSVPKGEGVP